MDFSKEVLEAFENWEKPNFVKKDLIIAQTAFEAGAKFMKEYQDKIDEETEVYKSSWRGKS